MKTSIGIEQCYRGLFGLVWPCRTAHQYGCMTWSRTAGTYKSEHVVSAVIVVLAGAFPLGGVGRISSVVQRWV